jgi:type I site-specific deoxyribonuclease, hsdR family
LLIVVNMFLTGFDATTLNTLWVDKNLRMHGLIQAYSRTNRILNSIKTYGNIVTFRNLEDATNKALALFGDRDAKGVVLLRPFRDYYEGYEDAGKKTPGYVDLIAELKDKFPVGEMITGEQEQKEFVKLYGAILRLKNILSSFDEFIDQEILSQRDVQDYHSMYIDLYNELRPKSDESKENINDDVIFEMELIKQVEINIDYILELIRQYHDSHLNNKEILVDIDKVVNSSIELRNKKDLIEQFIASLTVDSSVDGDWQEFVKSRKIKELDQIIDDEKLDKKATYTFVENAFRDGYIQSTGTGLSRILPPMSRFSPSGERSKKRETVLEKLRDFFDRFFDVSSGKL